MFVKSQENLRKLVFTILYSYRTYANLGDNIVGARSPRPLYPIKSRYHKDLSTRCVSPDSYTLYSNKMADKCQYKSETNGNDKKELTDFVLICRI